MGQQSNKIVPEVEPDDGELDLEGIDDNEIEAYLMTREEALKKKETWEKINADYIQQQKGVQNFVINEIKYLIYLMSKSSSDY